MSNLAEKYENDSDLEYFESVLPSLLKNHNGQFALIKNQKIHGFYQSPEEALKEGYKKFGMTNFIIQEITDVIGRSITNSAFLR